MVLFIFLFVGSSISASLACLFDLGKGHGGAPPFQLFSRSSLSILLLLPNLSPGQRPWRAPLSLYFSASLHLSLSWFGAVRLVLFGCAHRWLLIMSDLLLFVCKEVGQVDNLHPCHLYNRPYYGSHIIPWTTATLAGPKSGTVLLLEATHRLTLSTDLPGSSSLLSLRPRHG